MIICKFNPLWDLVIRPGAVSHVPRGTGTLGYDNYDDQEQGLIFRNHELVGPYLRLAQATKDCESPSEIARVVREFVRFGPRTGHSAI